MIRRLIILLLIVGLFAQDNDASKIRFDPETGEIIESDSLEIHNSYQLIFDPYTGEQIISFDTLGLYDSSKIIPRNSYSGNIVYGSPLKDKSKFHKNYKKSVHSVLFFYPVYTSPNYNGQNKIIGAAGISPLMLGYYRKNYFKPLITDNWNTFWHWGTIYFIVPYVGLGTEYVSKDGFIFGLSTFYWLPTITIGKYF